MCPVIPQAPHVRGAFARVSPLLLADVWAVALVDVEGMLADVGD